MLTAALESCQAQKSDAIRLNWEYEARITNLQSQLAAKDDKLQKHLLAEMQRNFDLKLEIDELKQENQRFKSALEFYADKNSWNSVSPYGDSVVPLDFFLKPEWGIIVQDCGKRARQALSGGEG